jgi:hypothetical protein
VSIDWRVFQVRISKIFGRHRMGIDQSDFTPRYTQ